MATVDTSLPAKPTGAAAEFAAAHSAEHPLKLYGGWFCPFVQRSWIVLHEKKIPHQYVEINPYKKAPEFLALNPRGLVPTLAVPVDAAPSSSSSSSGREQQQKQQRRPLYESSIICEYLDDAYADPAAHGPALLPSARDDPYGRARCRLWMDHVGGKVVPGFYRLLQHTPDKSDYTRQEARSALLSALKTLVAEMADPDGDGGGGPWFLGRDFSLVDVMLAPWAKRLFLLDHYKPGGLGVPAAAPGQGQGSGADEEEDEALWARWRIWFDAAVSRPSVVATWSDDDMYVEAYRRYAEDTTQSEVAQATRKGRKLP
ncbi:glutathione S-transferase [Xylariaceae sp. FL0804]|nr:glutathione S-transferase [Xylariaceae sp. FL0804]